MIFVMIVIVIVITITIIINIIIIGIIVIIIIIIIISVAMLAQALSAPAAPPFMQLRFLCAAAFVARLRYRRAWRAEFLRRKLITLQQVLRAGPGEGPSEAIQDWLIDQTVLLANKPRRPELLRQEELEAPSDDEQDESAE